MKVLILLFQLYATARSSSCTEFHHFGSMNVWQIGGVVGRPLRGPQAWQIRGRGSSTEDVKFELSSQPHPT